MRHVTWDNAFMALLFVIVVAFVGAIFLDGVNAINFQLDDPSAAQQQALDRAAIQAEKQRAETLRWLRSEQRAALKGGWTTK